MRVRASLVWRVATAVAFGVTAALAVTLSKGAPINAALTSDKGAGTTHAYASAPAAPSKQSAVVTARCAAAGLRISLGPGARLTTATTRYALEFTNVSGAPCTLAGYPQVAAYRGDGILVGPAAARDTSVVRRVLLAPGQTAHAVLDATVPAARCRLVRASGLRVVTPGQTGARYVGQPLTTCAARAAHGQNYLHVRAIQPGTGGGTSTGTSGGTGTLAVVRPQFGAARPSSTVA